MSKTIVDKGIRFQNYIIDLTIIAIMYLVVILLLNTSDAIGYVIFQSIYFLYYFIMEYKYGQTFGKKFTKSIAVDKSGNPMTTKKIMVRTAFRFVSLDSLSFLMGNNVGMHDWFSGTRVIKIN